MSVKFIKNDDQLVCEFFGRMDTLACMEIEKAVNEKIDNHKGEIVFELKDVTYIASSFLRFFGRTIKAVGAENFKVVNVAPEIRKVLKIAGLADRLNISRF